MFRDQDRPFLLVLEDVEETALLIDKLLNRSGYRVSVARNELELVALAQAEMPDLILISVGLNPDQLVSVADRIRGSSAVNEQTSIVLFCNDAIPEGAEIDIGKKIYLTRPDDFNQLRGLIHRLAWNDCGH